MSPLGRLLGTLALGFDVVFIALVCWMMMIGPIGFADELGPRDDPTTSRTILGFGFLLAVALFVLGIGLWRYQHVGRGAQRLVLVLLACLALVHVGGAVAVLAVGYPWRNAIIGLVLAAILMGTVFLVRSESRQRARVEAA